MIRVLQSWDEIGEAVSSLERSELPLHGCVQKNWDHALLRDLLSRRDRSSTVVDLGYGEGHTLRLLSALGFCNLHGVDMRNNWKLRLGQLRWMWRHRSPRPPFRLHTGDFTKTSFRDSSVDVAVSISAIEHGVDLSVFLKEVRRILVPRGCLFVTTDYWEEGVRIDPSLRAFGVPWKVFSRDDIAALLRLAEENGLVLQEQVSITPCAKRTVHWQKADYTSIALALERSSEARSGGKVSLGCAREGVVSR